MNNNISKEVINRFNNYIDIAKALKCHKQTGRSFHVTFAVQKKKVLAIGINNYDRVVSKIKYGQYKIYGPESYKPCLHSEISVILKLGREDCSNIEFYNIRIDNNNEIASSKPCNNCMNMFNILGFKKIYYINNQGKIKIITN